MELRRGLAAEGNQPVNAGRLQSSFAPLADVSSLVLVVVRPSVEDHGALARRCMLALGLATAEAEVLARITAGEAPKQMAAGRQVGLATIRTLVRRALDRTSCSIACAN